MMNTCYSFVDAKNVMHVASVHMFDPAQKTMVAVKGAGGVSDKASELEGTYAWGWAKNIWAEALHKLNRVRDGPVGPFHSAGAMGNKSKTLRQRHERSHYAFAD